MIRRNIVKGNNSIFFKYSKIFQIKYSTSSLLTEKTNPENNRPELSETVINLQSFPPETIRNFSIIAHIDHGKTTLADRLLELCGAIDKSTKNLQVLDNLEIEKERGITVKAQTVSLIRKYKDKTYLLNLIDTPGHVDFTYEVSRALAACEGTLLLVDATKGIQAQTIANFYQAFIQDLHIIPVINKIDLNTASVANTTQQILNTLEFEDENEIIKISAKSGKNVELILDKIIQFIPPPKGCIEAPLKALMFDSWYSQYTGVVLLVSIKEGTLSTNDTVVCFSTKKEYEIKEIGILTPSKKKVEKLYAGQVGYIISNLKNTKEITVGDTLYLKDRPIEEALPGLNPSKPMVYSGIYPIDPKDRPQLQESVDRLMLNDPSVTCQKETSIALGQGWRLGFLGTLHMDVFKQRLEREYSANIIITQPTVPFVVVYQDKEEIIRTPAQFPSYSDICTKKITFKEPYCKATIIVPTEYYGNMMGLVSTKRALDIQHSHIDQSRISIKFNVPLAEIVTDFYDNLKSKSCGYASFDYEESGYYNSELVKVSIHINGTPVDVLDTIQHETNAQKIGKTMILKLKGIIERQLYEVNIQAFIKNKSVGKERISAISKNVTAKCKRGGDQTRKMKLLDKQKEGKKRLKKFGNVDLPTTAFYTLLSSNENNK